MSHTKKPWSRRRKIVVAIIAIYLVFMIPFSVLMFREMSHAKSVFNSFNEDWMAHNYSNAVSLLTPVADPATGRKSFVDFFNLLGGRVGSLRSYKSTGIETSDNASGWRTTIHAHLTFERGELDFVYVLKKTQDHWYIDKIDQE